MVSNIATYDAPASPWIEHGDPEPNPSSLFVCLIVILKQPSPLGVDCLPFVDALAHAASIDRRNASGVGARSRFLALSAFLR
jgi:hypothetical protein